MRRPVTLSGQTETRLRAYALAAAGSSMGLLAFAQPAEAEIVFTSADVTITVREGTVYDLDLNGEGITDFEFRGAARETSMYVKGLGRNNVLGILSFGSSACYAAALEKGRGIGAKSENCNIYAGMVFRGFGGWVDVSDRYLGFQFIIDDQTHYGWARLSVRVSGHHVKAHLTGYAYETVPNQPIKAGQTTDTEDNDAAKPQGASSREGMIRRSQEAGSLGALALGSLHLPD